MSASSESVGVDVLPAGWEIKPLGDLVTKLSDGSHNPPKKKDSGRMMLSARNIDNNEIIFDKYRYISEEDFEKEHKRTQVTPGDVLLTIVGTIGRSAVVPEGLDDFTFQRSVAVLTPEGLLPKYLMYQFQAPFTQRFFEENARGTAQKGVYLKTLATTPIRVAPLDQQERIVAEIEKQFSRLDEAVASLKRVRANLKRYKALVLKAAVEGKLTEEWRKQNPDVEPASKLLERILAERRAKWEEAELAKMKAKGREPKNDKWREKYKEPASLGANDLPSLPVGWSWGRFEQLLEILRNGISKKPDQADGLAILRISAVRPLAVDLKDIRYLPQGSREEFSGYELKNGDLLFTRYNGNPDFVGVCGAVSNVAAPTVHPDKIIRAQVVNDNASQPRYLELALNAGESRAYIASKVRTTAGQSGISGSDIRNVPVPLPPADEQPVLVELADERLSVIESLAAQIDTYLLRTERLKSSILSQAFSAGIK